MKKAISFLIILFTCGIPMLCYCQTGGTSDTAFVKKMLQESMDSSTANPAISIQLAQRAIGISRRLKYLRGIGNGLILAGSSFASSGKADSAELAFREALDLATKNNMYGLQMTATLNLGHVYDERGNDAKAKEYYEAVLKLNQSHPDSEILANLYYTFGQLVARMNDDTTAIKYFLKGVDLAVRLHMYNLLLAINSNMSESYSFLKQFKSSYAYGFRTLSLSDSLHSTEFLSGVYTVIANCHVKEGNNDSAIYYFRKAIVFGEKMNDLKCEVQALAYMGETFYNMGRMDSAEKYSVIAAKLANSTSYKLTLFTIQHSLAGIYAHRHNYKSAYEYLDSAYNTRDSLLDQKEKEDMVEIAVRYDTREVDNRNKLLSKENDLQKLHLRQKNIFIYGSLSAFIGLLVISSLLFRQKEMKTKQQKIELEQKQLRAQMNPHFIFNCLNSIQHFVVANDVKNANKYLSGFASLMRQTLENSKEGTITLRKELAYLENYLALEIMRFEDKFTCQVVCADELDKDALEIPSMIIQPFVENAIRHGLCYLKGTDGRLTIRFYQKDAHLFCEIDDNGIGREQSQKLKMLSDLVYESQGMELTRQRLALVSKNYGSDYQIEVKDKKDEDGNPGGTTVVIKFPTS